jgi:hypothetical protein
MSISPTIPDLYKYGFLTSRAIGLLSRASNGGISEEERQVLAECRELVEKIIRGKDFLIGSNPEGVRNLRPDDVETFTYMLQNDSEIRSRASNEESLKDYLEGILKTLGSLVAEPRTPVDEAGLKTAAEFLSRVTNALLQTARGNLRTAPPERPAATSHG